MKKHPLLAAGAAAGTAVLGAAYAVYRVAFYQKPTTKVPSPADMPTRECYRKAMGPDADALARDMFKAVHITAQDGTPLAARYYHHADGAPLAIIFHGYRGYAERDGLGGYTLCTALGYNVLLPDQRAHGYSGGHTITMGVKERYDARDWTVWARSRFGPEVPIFLMGVSMGAATVLLAAGLNLPDNVCGIVADCGYTSPREITRKCLPEYLPGMPLELKTGAVIPGVMLTGVNSDLPGNMIAQVSQHIFDSATGRNLLIPQGTKIYGVYDSRIVYGQERVLIAWNRLIFPDGSSISLGAMPGADMGGMAGLNDDVNNHYMRIFGSALMMSLVSGGMAYALDGANDSTKTDNGTRMTDEMTASLAQQLGQTTTTLLQRNLSIKPTLEIRPGYQFNIVVTKDVIFKEPYTRWRR